MAPIGNHCFVGHGVMFINDDFKSGGPAGGDQSLWKTTEIGNQVSIGSNSTILPVKVCDGCVIGAGSVVTSDLTVKRCLCRKPCPPNSRTIIKLFASKRNFKCLFLTTEISNQRRMLGKEPVRPVFFEKTDPRSFKQTRIIRISNQTILEMKGIGMVSCY